MKIKIFIHPEFVESRSMPKYANFLLKGMTERGYKTEFITAKAYLYTLPFPKFIKKYLGYFDQYVIFPFLFKLKKENTDTLYVFADQALGPWVKLVIKRPHVIHCHDLIANKSAKRYLSENNVSYLGKIYQKYIEKGFIKGNFFVSISENTRNELEALLPSPPIISEVVYNGLNLNFKPANKLTVRNYLAVRIGRNLDIGYLLHVGGNQFYKNRSGVIEIYDSWRELSSLKLPLVLVGRQPDNKLLNMYINSIYKKDIHFVNDADDELLLKLYQGASVFLFPSLEEGFGWPIAEAQASGCPVITTNKPPMNEVGGDAAIYIDRKGTTEWSKSSAEVLQTILNLNEKDRNELISLGLENSLRFNADKALDKIENIYLRVFNSESNAKNS